MDNVIIERARAALKEQNSKQQRALAAEIGISFSGLRRILAGGSCTVRSLSKIASKFGTEHERQILGLIDRRAADPLQQQAAANADQRRDRQQA